MNKYDGQGSKEFYRLVSKHINGLKDKIENAKVKIKIRDSEKFALVYDNGIEIGFKNGGIYFKY